MVRYHSLCAFAPRTLADWLFYNWGFSMKLYYLNSISTSHFPYDDHNRHHFHYLFLKSVIISRSVFGLFWSFSSSSWGVWAQSGDGQAWSSNKCPSSRRWGMGRTVGGPLGCAPPGMKALGDSDTDYARQWPPPAPLPSSPVSGPVCSMRKPPSLGTVLRDSLPVILGLSHL